MKKILSFILAVVLTVSLLTNFIHTHSVPVNAATTSDWPTAPKVNAKSAILMEASTGTILYDKKCHKKMYPASITKIMTALLTIENCKIDEEVVFSENAVNSLQYDDANFGCQVGEKMSVKDCLYTLMLASANEVATALAEHIAGSVDKFAEMMNTRAKEAGATNTHFVNANGLHNTNHYVTAYDMAMITKAASQYSLFNDIVNTTTYTVPKNNKRKDSAPANQRHKMVWPTSPYYYADAIGGKTGYTDQSGTTLVTYAKRNGMTLIVVVLHSNGSGAYTDTKALFDYGFDNFNLVNVSQNDSRFSEGDSPSVQSPFSNSTDLIYIDKESNVVIPKSTDFSKLTSQVEFNESDDSFATITYKLGDRALGTATLKYESNTSSKNTEESLPNTTTSQEEQTTKISNENSDKNSNEQKTSNKIKNFKLPKILIPITVIIFVIVITIVVMVMHQRRINRIRAMKRQRKR